MRRTLAALALAAAALGASRSAAAAPPVITAIPDRTVRVCDEVALGVEAHDPDGDLVTITAASSLLGAGATYDPVAHLFRWAPSDAQAGGTFAVTFTATAAGDQVALTVNLTARARPTSGQTLHVTDPGGDLRAGSLGAAITAANASPDTVDTIVFDLPPGATTIALATPLPTVTGPVVLDGLSQAGATSTAPAITLDGGALTTSGVPGLTLTAGCSTVRGLRFTGFAGERALELDQGGTNDVRAVVITGSARGGAIVHASSRNTLGAAGAPIVIYQSDQDGLVLDGSHDNLLRDVSVTGALQTGLLLIGASSNRVGDVLPGEGCALAANRGGGLTLAQRDGVGSDDVIVNDVFGGGGDQNAGWSVFVDAPRTRIGGRAPNEPDVFGAVACSGAPGPCDQIVLAAHAAGAIVSTNGSAHAGTARNFISVDHVLGTAAAPILIEQNQINQFAGAGIVVAGTTDVTIDSNSIDQGTGGRSPGISLEDASRVAVTHNTISAVTGPGIRVVGASTGDLLRGNATWDVGAFSGNELLIDLGDDGPNANDPLDVDTGPNLLQNHPDVVAAARLGTSTLVAGRLASAARTTFVVEAFEIDAAADPCVASNQSISARSLGTFSVTTDTAGNASFTALLATQLAPGQVYVVTTATDPSGNTSEASGCVSAEDGVGWTSAEAITITDAITAPAFRVLVDETVTITDAVAAPAFRVLVGETVSIRDADAGQPRQLVLDGDSQLVSDPSVAGIGNGRVSAHWIARNVGTEPLDVTEITISGDSQFGIDQAPALPMTLAPGDSLGFDVVFLGAVVGTASATVDVAYRVGGGTLHETRGVTGERLPGMPSGGSGCGCASGGGGAARGAWLVALVVAVLARRRRGTRRAPGRFL